MNFVKYDGSKHNEHRQMPENMNVGQVIVRSCAPRYISLLKHKMREAMKLGMEFSTAVDDGKFAIRRDK